MKEKTEKIVVACALEREFAERIDKAAKSCGVTRSFIMRKMLETTVIPQFVLTTGEAVNELS